MSETGTGSHIQVAQDGTGKNVHTIELTLMQPDGSLITVEVQAVAIADRKGRIIDLDQGSVLAEIRDLLTDIKLHMELHS